MQSFIPPSFSLPLAWTVDLAFPFLLKAVQNIEEIVIRPEDRQMLRGLKDERVLFFTNHPSTAEPPVVYHIGNVMGSRFKFMASRQVFDWSWGLVGRVIQNLGAFSVIAGINDRESFKAARQALSEPAGKLAIFPEGEPTSGENDNLMPLQPGAVQLSFWAMEDAYRADPRADIQILPGFIKYVIQGTDLEIGDHLAESIGRIERRLGLDAAGRNLLRRFLAVGRVLLEQAEREYDITSASREDFDYRIGRVRHAILDNVADRLGMPNYNRRADAITKLRQLFAVMEMVMIEFPDPKLPRLSDEEKEWAHGEIIKAFDFIVIQRDYLVSRPTAERFYEWLARFESYVYGLKPRALGGEPSHLPRRAHVFFSDPFSVKDYWSPDKGKRKTGLEKMRTRIQQDMEKLLTQALELTQPLVKPYDVGDDPK